MSRSPATTKAGIGSRASASVGMWGWVTIRSSISQFALAFRLNRAGTRHIPQPSTMGSWVVSFTPEGHRSAPLRISSSTYSGYFRANSRAMLPPSEKPSRWHRVMLLPSRNSFRSSANCSRVKGAVPLGLSPWPRVSTAMTRKCWEKGPICRLK